MAELFVGPIMEKIIGTCFEYLQGHLSWQIGHTGMKELEKRLRENHLTIQAVLSAASQPHIIDQQGTPLNKWIWQLRDAIDEADDLLDEFAYMEHEKRLAKNKERTKVRSPFKTLKGSGSTIHKFGKRILKTDSSSKRLEEIVQKLDKIAAEVSTFLYLLKDTKQVQQGQGQELRKAREEGSFPKSILIGRGEEKKYIIEWLEKADETNITANKLYNNISLLSIVGHGGMGKTSLLRHVYQDEMMKEFDLKIWVCVSNHFDIKKLIADMLESSKENRPSLDNINALQERLKTKVMSKKFLLILDDIWENEWDINKWETVLAPLAYGKLGSKILITTRMDCVASMISKVIQKETEKLSLEGLREDECLLLLNTHEFANVKNQNDHKKLKFIVEELVKKLFGCPLAAKVIGGVLNSKMDERFWTNMLDKALGHTEIFPILKLSYIFLSKELQNCFTFCSIFPEDHHFKKDDLVRMWIAVGFIQSSDIQGGDDLENIGGRYFDNLVEKSFFDKGYSNYYKMHDLLHDVARSISAQECFKFKGDQKFFTRIPETIRHLSIDTSNVEVLRNLGKFKNLRTLWITNVENIEDFDDLLTTIFKETRSIRLLCIANYCTKLIPETIGYLMHLRYLRLDFDDLTLFPKPLCNLYHLQYIVHSGHGSPYLCDDFFPREMSNLSNLRHTNFDSLKFPGIRKLKFLQELRGFCVKNEIGCRIGELEHMNDLHILDIYCLENVRDVGEACNAKLGDKRKLTKLSLNWAERYNDVRNNIADPNLDRVFDNLQPHRDLKVLKIYDYMGVRSALWMNKTDLIYNLEYIQLSGCLEWQNLPPFGQLRFLKFLRLFNMPKAKQVDNTYHGNDMCCAFQSLERLEIFRLEALEDWFDGGVEAEEDGCLFPCLTQLTLIDCPNLQELPHLPHKLKTLFIENIGWKTLNCCNISKSIPLETIKILHCPKLTYIFPACAIDRIAALETVEIEDCPNLIFFGGHEDVEAIGNIPASVESWERLLSSLSIISSLKNLSLNSIPLLKSLSYLPPSLESLYLKKLDNLDFLPSCLSTLTSLECLHIYKVHKLRELPDLPPSLFTLHLYKLDKLNCLPSCLPTLSSLIDLSTIKAPKLRELPYLPPSLCELYLWKLDNPECLPSCLPALSSLTELRIIDVPKLRELSDLPPSLFTLYLENLDNLDCLPSCLPTLSSLRHLTIHKVPELQESLFRIQKCRTGRLMESYKDGFLNLNVDTLYFPQRSVFLCMKFSANSELQQMLPEEHFGYVWPSCVDRRNC